MARPSAYYTSDGEKVPSVTTILGRFKESGGLVHWAWNLGMQKKDYRRVRDAAATAGSMTHDAIEAFLKGTPHEIAARDEVSDEEVEKAITAFSGFKQWATSHGVQATHTEYPLVSETHRFGGTLDAIIVDDGRAIGDWKTSNHCYPDYLVQLAAYGMLWEENFPDEPITGGYHLIRFDKDHGDFHHHWWRDLSIAREAFLLLRRLYEIDPVLKQRAQ